ncbi:hypothetical protein QF017_000782 [Pseudomonas laurylsulfatiphila]
MLYRLITFSVTPLLLLFCNPQAHGIRGLRTESLNTVTEITLSQTSPLPCNCWATTPSLELSPRCRVPQAFSTTHSRAQPPAWAGFSWVRVCRKNDTFSPQAWRGDDGARQVKTSLPSRPCTKKGQHPSSVRGAIDLPRRTSAHSPSKSGCHSDFGGKGGIRECWTCVVSRTGLPGCEEERVS